MFDIAVITDLVKNWGYIAVVIGSLFEGEVILITASALSALGYLDIYKVFVIALCTTVFADQFLFFLGYKLGTDWIIRDIFLNGYIFYICIQIYLWDPNNQPVNYRICKDTT